MTTSEKKIATLRGYKKPGTECEIPEEDGLHHLGLCPACRYVLGHAKRPPPGTTFVTFVERDGEAGLTRVKVKTLRDEGDSSLLEVTCSTTTRERADLEIAKWAAS